jgi:hypothetical protein
VITRAEAGKLDLLASVAALLSILRVASQTFLPRGTGSYLSPVQHITLNLNRRATTLTRGVIPEATRLRLSVRPKESTCLWNSRMNLMQRQLCPCSENLMDKWLRLYIALAQDTKVQRPSAASLMRLTGGIFEKLRRVPYAGRLASDQSSVELLFFVVGNAIPQDSQNVLRTPG